MKFYGIVRSSLIDYPGKISAVLFVHGCNYDCYYCHNRPLLEDWLEPIDTDELRSFLVSRGGLLDGIVISGGEPTLDPALPMFLRELHSLGFSVKLDTNGSSPDVIRRLIDERLVDYVAVDYKAPQSKYASIAGSGVNPQAVLETIRLLCASDTEYEVRTTVCPELTLSDLKQMTEELPLLKRYVLNPYRKPKRFKPEDADRIETPMHSDRDIASFANELSVEQPGIVLTQ
jgi:pyruvate formate lyase activating enzyme